LSLLANGADQDEIVAAVAKVADHLRAAVAGHEAECFPLCQLSTDELRAFVKDEVGGFIALTGGGWSVEQRQEWIDQCTVEFAQVPVSVLIPAVRLARKTIHQPARFVSWVFESIARDLLRLELEGRQLEHLARIGRL
jgi:hypothetical protein